MRDWHKKPPTEKEIEAARQVVAIFQQRHGQDMESMYFAVGEHIVKGSIEAIEPNVMAAV